MLPKRRSPLYNTREKIEAKVRRNKAGCWIWTGSHTTFGYGETYFYGERWGIHRLFYTWYRGEVPEDLCVCHHCDVRDCCNPEHLFLGTYKDNIHDMIRKGRQGNVKKTHCIRGHELAGANLYLRYREGRRIRQCKLCCTAQQRIALGWPKRLAYVKDATYAPPPPKPRKPRQINTKRDYVRERLANLNGRPVIADAGR